MSDSHKRFKQLMALDVQLGGSHYKSQAIQPIQYIHANKLPYIEGNVVKYITRWRDKNGLEDLLKIKHYVDLLIDLEGLDEPVPNDEGRADRPVAVGTKCDRNL